MTIITEKSFWMYTNFCISVWMKIIIILQISCVDSIASSWNVRMLCFDMQIHIFLSMLSFFAKRNRAPAFTSVFRGYITMFDELIYSTFFDNFIGLCKWVSLWPHWSCLWLTRINNWNTAFHITGYQRNRDIKSIGWLNSVLRRLCNISAQYHMVEYKHNQDVISRWR